ncbi:hypothetical protein Tco_0176556, partial [Tanacetum coccineum]
MLGIPVGGYSLFKLDERETGDEFVKEWADQFSPIALKKIRADGLKGEICLDVVKRVREDTMISDIDWCGYVYDCLRDSKLQKGTNNYLGPLTFLITSYLMRQRQELELKKRVVGLLDLNSNWTETEVKEGEGFIGSVENSKKE